MKYIALLERKGKTLFEIIWAVCIKFNPSKKELTNAWFSKITTYLSGDYRDYDKRKYIEKLLTEFNSTNPYEQEIISRRMYDKKTKKYLGWLLVSADNRACEAKSKLEDKLQKRHEVSKKRNDNLAKDKTMKRRARKLLKEIEA